jgi:hypothetical protein
VAVMGQEEINKVMKVKKCALMNGTATTVLNEHSLFLNAS